MKRWKSFLLFLTVMGPGIITANIDNDASGITTYSVAGHASAMSCSGRSSRRQ